MVPFTYDLTLTLNNKSKVDVIYFDFAKAFDSVSHDLILKKLKHEYKVDGLMLGFIKSYLQGRQQQVVIRRVVHIKLPEHFTFVEAEQVRYTHQTSAIINNVDKTLIKCNIRPTGGRFRYCFFYWTMDLWNRLPSHIRQVTNVSIFKVKLTTFLWGADTDWPDKIYK